MFGMGIELEAYEACQTCDRSTEPADVHAEQKLPAVIREAGEQERRRYIAYDLTHRRADQKLAPMQQALQQRFDRVHTRKISRENEEAHKGEQQPEIRRQQPRPVKDKQHKDH